MGSQPGGFSTGKAAISPLFRSWMSYRVSVVPAKSPPIAWTEGYSYVCVDQSRPVDRHACGGALSRTGVTPPRPDPSRLQLSAATDRPGRLALGVCDPLLEHLYRRHAQLDWPQRPEPLLAEL